MNRKEFLKKTALLGLAAPFLSSLLTSCREEEEDPIPSLVGNFSGKVIVIGAGAAGITTAYVLARNGIEVEVLEASAIHGGRLKRDTSLADFPIDLGAEWLHTSPAVLSEILNDPSVNVGVDIVPYAPETIQAWNGSSMQSFNVGNSLYGEFKFKDTTWFGFFDRYLVPTIQDRIRYNQPVSRIDYQGSQVVVTTANGQALTADKVVVTVPLNILKQELIDFQPGLPAERVRAMDQVTMDEGFKAFIEFSERFYPDIFAEELSSLASSGTTPLFYNAAFRKDSSRHVLGLFSVGVAAARYSDLNDEAAQLDRILSDLDRMFEGRATPAYRNHVIQDWTHEPYIQGSYSSYGANAWDLQSTLNQSLDNKVYFAGEAYASDYSTAHGAALSGYAVVERMLGA